MVDVTVVNDISNRSEFGPFRSVVNDITGVFCHARAARDEYLKSVVLAQIAHTNPHNRMFFTKSLSGPDAIAHQAWRVHELPTWLSDEGLFGQLIGHQWVVFLYSVWDEIYRPHIEADLDTKLQVPLLGDIRLLRHDIIHNKGLASGRYTGKMEVLDWFSDGEQLILTDDHIAEFQLRIGNGTPMDTPMP